MKKPTVNVKKRKRLATYSALKLAQEITAPKLRALAAELAELRRRGLIDG